MALITCWKNWLYPQLSVCRYHFWLVATIFFSLKFCIHISNKKNVKYDFFQYYCIQFLTINCNEILLCQHNNCNVETFCFKLMSFATEKLARLIIIPSTNLHISNRLIFSLLDFPKIVSLTFCRIMHKH